MLYLIAFGIALSVGLAVLALGYLLPAQGRPSRSRMLELGLEGPFSKDAAFRRGRNRSQLKELLEYMGRKVETSRNTWGTTKTRLAYAGYRQPAALAVYLGVRVGAAGVLYFYGILVGVGLGTTSGMT